MSKEINFFEQFPPAIEKEEEVLPQVDATEEEEALPLPPAAPLISSSPPPTPLAPTPSPSSLRENKLAAMLDKIQAAKQEIFEEEQGKARVKRVIEALLFATSEPIAFDKLREITDLAFPLKPRILQRLIQELQEEYLSQNRSFRLEETDQGFIVRSCEEYGHYIEQLYRNRRGEKLSQAATEVLAIIAYRQPITRPAIEAIRGVDSSGITQSLLERGLIEVVGRQEGPGRPSLYAVTAQFLHYFGLRELKELPGFQAT